MTLNYINTEEASVKLFLMDGNENVVWQSNLPQGWGANR